MSQVTHEIAPPDHEPALLPPPPGSIPEPAKPEPPKPQPPKAGAPPPPSVHPKRRRWLWIVGFLLLIVLAWIFWPKSTAKNAAKNAPGGRGGRGANAVTPVVAVRAVTGNIGVYVTGLGAITPIYTVTVRSRVDVAS